MRASGFGAQVGALLSLPLASADGTILLAGAEDDPEGVVAALSFPGSNSGWIGALGVRPHGRGRGTGRALTEAAITWLRSRGAGTIGLFATDAGRGVYDGLGFEPADRAVAWRGAIVAPAVPVGVVIRSLNEGDRAAVLALDRAQAGEDREPLIAMLEPLRGWIATGDAGDPLGFALKTPWGAACPVIAGSRDAGVALLAAVAAQPGGGTLIVPEGNAAALEAVASWRLGRLNDALRMHLGTPPPRRPEGQFATFNLFWG
ncbi:MAG: GNAT family N-acetyltransferase [Baekduia sp.]